MMILFLLLESMNTTLYYYVISIWLYTLVENVHTAMTDMEVVNNVSAILFILFLLVFMWYGS